MLWLRSFHNPIAIRLTVQGDGSAQLIAKTLTNEGFPTPGKLVKNQTIQLSKDHVRWFLEEIDQLKYWELKSAVGNGCDGAEWILEGAKNHKYNVVRQWSPKRGPIRTLGSMMLFEMARLKIPPNQIY